MDPLLLILIILLLVGGGIAPVWGHSAAYGWGPSGLVGVLVVILILRLLGVV